MSGDAHLYKKIAEFEDYRKKLRELEPYTGFDDFTRRQRDSKEQALKNSLKDVENSIMELVNRYHSRLAAEPIDIMIAELLEMMPQDNIRLARVVNARGNGMTP